VAGGIDEIESGDLLKNPAVALVAGTAAVAVEGGRVAARLVTNLPVIGPWLRRGVGELTARGDQVIKQDLDPARDVLLRVVGRRSLRVHPLIALLRAVACVLFPIGLVWVALDHDRKSLQDIVFRTRVLYVRPV
jgi:uncharacterized RDD family membrane protein YckC